MSPTISGSDLAEEGQIWPGLFETIEKVRISILRLNSRKGS
jgi:hypothetical protein